MIAHNKQFFEFPSGRLVGHVLSNLPAVKQVAAVQLTRLFEMSH